MSYVYYLYRFKVSIVIDDQILAQDSQLGQVISYFIGTVVAIVAKEIGTPAADLVRRTLEVASHAFAIRVIQNQPLQVDVAVGEERALSAESTRSVEVQ